jgi:vesicle-associated membrane protein 7
MTILYALVSRGTTVLSEYTETSGNISTITRVLLSKIADEDGKMSYVYDQYVFHYIVENHILYLCMCDDKQKRMIPFGFLEDIKTQFKAKYGDRAQTAIAFSLNDDFGRVLSKQMVLYKYILIIHIYMY